MTNLKTIIAVIVAGLFISIAIGCTKRVEGRASSEAGIDTSKTAAVKVVIEGIEHSEGVIRLALFNTPEGFPGKMEKVYRRLELPITGETVEFTIEMVPSGRYAVSVYHDENGNDSMETDVIGRPSEGYGFSNNAKGRFGPPSFEAASFLTSGDPIVIRIKLNY